VVGDVAHDVQVVADQHHSAAAGDVVAREFGDHRGADPVEAGGGLIEQEHLRIEGEGPGKTHPLGLASGQPVGAALTEAGGETGAGQQFADTVVGEIRTADAEIVGHPVGEQDRLLGDQTDATAQRQHVEFDEWRPIEKDTAGGRRGQPGEQPQQGGLARAARPDDGRALPSRQARGELVEKSRRATRHGHLIQFESTVWHATMVTSRWDINYGYAHGPLRVEVVMARVTRQAVPGKWVLLSYRVPREPSTPRITIWRKLKRLGVAQISDGLVALPADARTREQLEWIAEEIVDVGGSASIWLAEPGSVATERELAAAMSQARTTEYTKIIAEAQSGARLDPGARLTLVRRLRADLLRVQRRDYFPPAERTAAGTAIDILAASVLEQEEQSS
jgi:hypothetical protein